MLCGLFQLGSRAGLQVTTRRAGPRPLCRASQACSALRVAGETQGLPWPPSSTCPADFQWPPGVVSPLTGTWALEGQAYHSATRWPCARRLAHRRGRRPGMLNNLVLESSLSCQGLRCLQLLVWGPSFPPRGSCKDQGQTRVLGTL